MLELSYVPAVRQSGANAKRSSAELDQWGRFDRYLRGIDGGTLRTGTTPVAPEPIRSLLAIDGPRFVSRIVAASHTGLEPKNDPAIFSLALAAKQGDEATRRSAYAALPAVCRTLPELMQFAHHAQSFGGWGRGMRTAVGAWFNTRPVEELIGQLVQFPAHAGFTARDLLRLSHPRAATPAHDALYAWAVRGTLRDDAGLDKLFAIGTLARTTELSTASALIRDSLIPLACVPQRWLAEPEVWEALLPMLSPAELLASLAPMTRVGLLVAGSAATGHATRRLEELEEHPYTILATLVGYRTGRGRQSWWLPVLDVIDSLEVAFYAAIDRVGATEPRTLVALDISSSMASGSLGVPGLTPRLASAAMALLTAQNGSPVGAFTTHGDTFGGKWGGGSPNLTPLAIGRRARLDDIVDQVSALPMGGTDCALPMIWAQRNQIDVETFVVYTDDETWAGDVPPVRALRAYRDARGIPAKLIVVGMMSKGFRLADPDDAGMLDVVGFDASTPPVLSDFARA